MGAAATLNPARAAVGEAGNALCAPGARTVRPDRLRVTHKYPITTSNRQPLSGSSVCLAADAPPLLPYKRSDYPLLPAATTVSAFLGPVGRATCTPLDFWSTMTCPDKPVPPPLPPVSRLPRSLVPTAVLLDLCAAEVIEPCRADQLHAVCLVYLTLAKQKYRLIADLRVCNNRLFHHLGATTCPPPNLFNVYLLARGRRPPALDVFRAHGHRGPLWFMPSDICSCYPSVRLPKATRDWFGFYVPDHGYFRYVTVPFGWTGAVTLLQSRLLRAIKRVLAAAGLLDSTAFILLVIIDDILCISHDRDLCARVSCLIRAALCKDGFVLLGRKNPAAPALSAPWNGKEFSSCAGRLVVVPSNDTLATVSDVLCGRPPVMSLLALQTFLGHFTWCMSPAGWASPFLSELMRAMASAPLDAGPDHPLSVPPAAWDLADLAITVCALGWSDNTPRPAPDHVLPDLQRLFA